MSSIPAQTPLLEIRGLTVSYDSVLAVRDLDLTVNQGQVVALLGPNGAGKSSTLLAIMGCLGRQAGSVEFDGESIAGLAPDRIARRGLGLVPEGRNIFADLTVRENLTLGFAGRPSRDGAQADLEWVCELFPILADFMGRQAGLLSGGQQQMLAIGRALLADPRLLMLDEPSLGLAPSVIDSVFEALDRIRDQGRTILIVEQRATRTAAFADRSHVLANGEIRLTIDRGELDDDQAAEAIASAYFGS